MDVSGLTDYVLERASIGSVMASSLGREDPEINPKYKYLPENEFEKVCLKLNAGRDIYGLCTIASLTYSK
jgi:hypothetical protein